MSTNQKYEAAFKKKSSGRLFWISCFAPNETEAMFLLCKRGWSPGHRHKHNGYKLYGGPLLCKN